jgi:hypothetical protein
MRRDVWLPRFRSIRLQSKNTTAEERFKNLALFITNNPSSSSEDMD